MAASFDRARQEASPMMTASAMRRQCSTYALILCIFLAAAQHTSAIKVASIAPGSAPAVWLHGQKFVSGAASNQGNSVRSEPRLSEKASGESLALAYGLASDDAVAVRGLGAVDDLISGSRQLSSSHAYFSCNVRAA